MDILIKGMEMPRGNNVLVVDSAGTITKVNRWTGKVEATDPFSVKAVALPEHHGRLIIADALLEKLERIVTPDDLTYTIARGILKQIIEDAETIVEANNE